MDTVVYKLTIGYDGTDFHGFQLQPRGIRTVQGELAAVLERLYQIPVTVYGAGRTDAGVHARGQVVTFKGNELIPQKRLIPALNSMLPDDIVVYAAEEVSSEFHPQHDSTGKMYTYTIDNRPIHRVLWRRYAWHYPRQIDQNGLRRACDFLIGEHDFKSFQTSGSSAKTSVRCLTKLSFCYENDFLVFTLEANGFLYRMVRNIVGTLMLVAKGDKLPSWVMEVLAAKDRTKAGFTAPAQGLCLDKVYYTDWVTHNYH